MKNYKHYYNEAVSDSKLHDIAWDLIDSVGGDQEKLKDMMTDEFESFLKKYLKSEKYSKEEIDEMMDEANQIKEYATTPG